MEDVYIDMGAGLATLPELKRMAQERLQTFRGQGMAAKAAGLPITADPHRAGSWVSTRWLEGWSGTTAPERWVSVGVGFNMTPAEEFHALREWLGRIGVDQARVREAMVTFRRGYREEVLPQEH